MNDPTVLTDRASFRRTAADAPGGARVPVELRVPAADPFDAYRRARSGPGGFFFETTGGQPGWGCFGVDPVERLQVSGSAVVADRATAESPNPHGDYRRETPTLAALSGLLDRETLVRGGCEVAYPCGAFGWLSYDVARELEDLSGGAEDDRGLPRLQVAVFETLASWDEPRLDEETTLRITSCPRIPEGTDLDELYDRAVGQGRDLAAAAVDGDPSVGPAPVAADEARFESDSGREEYAERVRRVKEYVRAGDTFQANVSQRLTAPAAVHPVEAYAALRRVNPAPYSGLVEFSRRPSGGEAGGADAANVPTWSGVDLVSASPELLLRLEGDRVETEPIAGTRPRGETPPLDEAFEAELLGDEKERAEHAMLVDLERNDLGKVCEYGSVEVSEYRRVDRYSEVMHLVSLVEGRLRPNVSLSEAVAAAFPGGTITGAPKPRTMEIIDELESTRRGPYTGSMAAFGFDGRATLNIVIRTLVRHAEEYHLRVGAGIVHDSDPESEYEETLAKGRALVNAIDEALAAGRMTVEGDATAEGSATAEEDADE